MKLNRSYAWYAFDMGNSAHAVLVSTVGFALYFKQYLMAGHSKADFSWGIITSIILVFSAIASPLLASWSSNKNIRGRCLTFVTFLCVFATALLGSSISKSVFPAVLVYIISALGYYIALPVYNSYLPEVGMTLPPKTVPVAIGVPA